MSSQGLGHNFKSSPSGLLVPSSVWNATLNAADVTHEMVGPADTTKFLRGDNPPTWQVPVGTPSGSAGGALDGTYPNPGIAASVAGAGLAETTNVLSVNVDGSTLEINTDTLRVKDAGITEAKIALVDVTTDDVTTTKHGFVPKAPNDAAKFLRGDAVWATVGGSGGGVVGNDAIWDAKGDLAAATGADAATRVAVGTNGQVLTAASGETAGVKWARAATTVLDYTTITAGVTITATTAAGATTVITAGSVTVDGSTLICVEFEAISMTAGANGTVLLTLWQGSTDLGTIVQGSSPSVAQYSRAGARRYLTPSAGSYVYSIRGFRTVANGSVEAGAGGAGTASPAYIRVTAGA